MLTSMLRNSAFHRKFRLFNRYNCTNRDIWTLFRHFYSQSKSYVVLQSNLTLCRRYHSRPEPQCTLPEILDEPIQRMPFLQCLTTAFKMSFLPVYMRDWDVDQFFVGAKHAASVISNALAKRDYDALEGLVTDNLIYRLRRRIDELSDEQRRMIAMTEDQIFFAIIHDIHKEEKQGDCILRVSMLYYYAYGMDEPMDYPPAGSLLNRHLLVCNYRYARTYVDKMGGSWKVDLINHCSLVPGK